MTTRLSIHGSWRLSGMKIRHSHQFSLKLLWGVLDIGFAPPGSVSSDGWGFKFLTPTPNLRPGREFCLLAQLSFHHNLARLKSLPDSELLHLLHYAVYFSFRWVFKQLYDKGLVYRGVKVMPFSTACNTPLSNFEAHQNYKVGTKKIQPHHIFCRLGQTSEVMKCVVFLWPSGCSGPICHRQLPIGWEWGGGSDCLDNHTLDTPKQPGPLCQPWDVICQGQRWEKTKCCTVLLYSYLIMIYDDG